MTQQQPIDPGTAPQSPTSAPKPPPTAQQYQHDVLPRNANVQFESVASSISADPNTHLRAGMGYKYERSAPIGDNALQIEKAKVYSLQKALLAIDKDLLGKIGWNYEKDFCDGIFGPKTADALKLFQQSNNLPPTGVLDKNTADAIVKRLASQNQPQGNPQPTAQPGAPAGPQTNSPQSPAQSPDGSRLQPQPELEKLLTVSKGKNCEKEVADLVNAIYAKKYNEAPVLFAKIVQVIPEHKARLANKEGPAAVSELISILSEKQAQ